MRGARGILAAIAGAALVFGLSGCGNSPPKITDEQVASWQKAAEVTVPAAQTVSVEVQNSGSDMFGRHSTYVAIDANFANIADLAASEQALVDLTGKVTAEASGNRVEFTAQYEGANADAAAVSETLPSGLSDLGVTKWYVADEPFAYDGVSQTLHSDWFLRIYVDDPGRVSPAWLANVTDGASTRLGEFHATIGFIQILPDSALSLDPASSGFLAAKIDVRDLDSFKAYGIKHNCVRTDTWVFDVADGYVRAYPAARPRGNCA